MEATGILMSASKALEDNSLLLTFKVSGVAPEQANDLQGCTLDIRAEVHREKRSLNANAYFHVLAGKIAEALGVGKTEVKNRLIREYGQYEYINGQIPTFKLKGEYETEALNREDIHVKPVGREVVDGIQWVRLAFMRGSHTYNTREMSVLIEGTVAEAKELGIETLSQETLQNMMAAWEGRGI